MYLRIEKEFQKRSKTRKSQILFILAILCCAILASFPLNKLLEEDTYFWEYYTIFCCILILFLVLCFVYIFLQAKKIKPLSFFEIDAVFNCYSETIHNSDLKILSKILKENDINTRPKVQEAIRHYQCLLPRKTTSNGQLLTILALVVSIIALLFSEPFAESATNIKVFFLILWTVIIGYSIIRFVAKNILKIFSKDALYTRLEASLSEIFMTYYLKKEDKSGEENNG